MKQYRWPLLLLALTLLLPGCRPVQPVQPEGAVLWFRTSPDQDHGPALDTQPYEGELQPDALLSALLSGPDQEGLISPFPRGVSLVQCQWDEARPGVLLVSLSEQYGALADISLSLADYCIVLTLFQVEGVQAVEITAEGHSTNYRSHQLLSDQEALLWDELADDRKNS